MGKQIVVDTLARLPRHVVCCEEISYQNIGSQKTCRYAAKNGLSLVNTIALMRKTCRGIKASRDSHY
jgi:hypothetical protein